MTFKEILFGMHAAEAERAENPFLLIDGFLDDHKYIEKLMSGYDFLVIGPKGSGKSAIASRIKLMEKEFNNCDSTLYELDDFKHSSILYDIPQKNSNKLLYQWDFILYIALLKSFVNDESYNDKFIYSNNYDEFVQERYRRVITISKYLGLLDWEDFSQITIFIRSPDFQYRLKKLNKFVNAGSYNLGEYFIDLKKICYAIKLKYKHIIIIDDIDEIVYSENQKHFESLFLLVKSVKSLNLELKRRMIPAKILVFCRQDIIEMIPALHKIRMNYSITLNWYQKKGKDKSNTELAKILNLRASLFFKREVNVFKEFFPEKVSDPWNFEKGTSSFLFSCTRYLPRDLILLMNKIQSCCQEDPTNEDIIEGIRQYSTEYFLGEIKDELNTYFFDNEFIEHVLNLLRSIGTCRFSMQRAYEVLNNNDEFKDIKVENVFNILYKCNAIGNINRNNNYPTFKYMNQASEFNKDQDIMVHRGLWLSLNMA